ncbi:hypothetical protein EV421DRAFT_431413 [Armillaria borealis]|uniref:Secreted protein n=1 Tax=Armillaria borealis TaxID=47425 RepID=A0AA39K513_9AGAR|nr:hypothetical protein EV421DRAFT_431413 [Armillaria borealis]
MLSLLCFLYVYLLYHHFPCLSVSLYILHLSGGSVIRSYVPSTSANVSTVCELPFYTGGSRSVLNYQNTFNNHITSLRQTAFFQASSSKRRSRCSAFPTLVQCTSYQEMKK